MLQHAILARSKLLVAISLCGILVGLQFRLETKYVKRKQSKPTRSTPRQKKYLVYFTHSGFSNQLLGLLRASRLAYATDRVLVLPPVLPHKGDEPIKLPLWTSRDRARDGCMSQHEYHQTVNRTKLDAVYALNNTSFPSFTDIIDFSQANKELGLEFIDMPEFVQRVCNNSTEGWYAGDSNARDLAGYCNRTKIRDYGEVVQVFEETFGEEPIAVIGSAFVIYNPFTDYKPDASFRLDRFFFHFPLSPKLKILLKIIYAELPSSYAGVHVRLPDGDVSTCRHKVIQHSYENIFEKLRRQNVTSGTTVFVAQSHRLAKNCFELYSNRSWSSVVSVDDIMNEETKRMVDDIPHEKATVYLVLDQILVAMADRLALDFSAARRSTFQSLIQKRHIRRNTTLANLER